MMRVPGAERLHVLQLPLAAHWFYHELWDKKYKTKFTLCIVLYAWLVLSLSPNPGTTYVAVALYYLSTLFLPMFYRMPEKALKDWKLANKDSNQSIADSRKIQRIMHRRTTSDFDDDVLLQAKSLGASENNNNLSNADYRKKVKNVIPHDLLYD